MISNNQRQCDPKGNVSFPLRFESSNTSNMPEQTPNLSMSFVGSKRKTNPKFEDNSRTSGGFLDESPSSFTITYLNNNYNLVSAQICLSTHSILLDKDKEKNIIDFILTLEIQEDVLSSPSSPSLIPRFIIIVIPLLKYDNNLVTTDNPYLSNILNENVPGNYSIENLFTGLTKFLWYQTCLEPHGDNALAYISLEGIKLSENLYLNLLGVWKKQSPYDIQNTLETAITNIKSNINNFCRTTTNENNVNDLNNSINTLQASVYVPKRNPSVESWPRYMAPYDIVLSVQTNPVVISSMSQRVEGFQTRSSSSVTGVFVTDSGGAQQPIILPERTSSGQPTEEEILNDLTRISQNSVDGKAIDLGQFKCVSLDMDGAVDENGKINFDTMGKPLTDLYTKRIALRTDAKVNKVSTDDLLKYFAYALAGILGLVLVGLSIQYIINNWINKSATASSVIPSNTSKIGLYLVMGFLMAFFGFLIGASVTSLV
jgi:hypothetical protein